MKKVAFVLGLFRDHSAAWFRVHALSRASNWWLAGISFLEAIVFPLPVDPYLIGVVVVRGRQWLLLASITTAASMAGAILGYAIGALFYDSVGERIVALYGLGEGFALAQERFEENVFWVILTGAFTPLPFKIFVLAGGFLKVSVMPFILATLLGRGMRYASFAYLAKLFGEPIAALAYRFFNWLTIGVVLAAFVAIAYYGIVRVL